MPAPDLALLNLLLTLGRNAEGEKAAREVIASDPEWGVGYSFLAIFLLRLHRSAEAREPAEKGVARAPQDPWALAVLADALASIGQRKEAHSVLDSVLRLDPTNEYALKLRVQFHLELNNSMAAASSAVDGLAEHPEDEGLQHALAWSEFKLGHFDYVLEVTEAGLRSHPRSSALLHVRGCALMAKAADAGPLGLLSLHRAAEATFRESIRLCPTDSAPRVARRENALACRRVAASVIVGAGVAMLVVLAIIPRWAAADGFLAFLGVFGRIAVGGLVLAGLRMTVLQSESLWLMAPAGWLGVPVVPVTPSERRAGRLGWIVLGILWLVCALAIVLEELSWLKIMLSD